MIDGKLDRTTNRIGYEVALLVELSIRTDMSPNTGMTNP